MPTRLFLNDTVNALAGIFPLVPQTTVVTPITQSIPGQDLTIRTMRSATSTAMVTRTFTSSATTVAQRVFHGYFCSDTLNVDQQIPPQSVKLNLANRESSLNMNLGTGLRVCAYVWRPMTSSLVGYLVDGLTMVGQVEPTTTSALRVNSASITSTATVSAAAGDVIICEIYQVFTQAAATAFTGYFGYNGTTQNLTKQTTVTNHASFFELETSSLSFGTPPTTISASFGQTLSDATMAGAGAITAPGFVSEGQLGGISWDAIAGDWDSQTLNWDQLNGATLGALTVAGTGTVVTPAASGTFSNTLGALTLAGTGAVPHTASYSNTLDPVTLTGIGSSPRNGSFANTLGAATLVGTGTVPHTATFSNTLGDVTLVGVGSLDAVVTSGTFNNTLADASLSAAGAVPVGGTYSNTLGAATLSGAGAVPHNATYNNTLATITLAGAGAVPHTATFDNLLGDATLAATGLILAPGAAVGTFNNTLAALMLAGTGATVTPVPVVPEQNQGAGSGGARASHRKKFVVPSDAPRRSPVDELFDRERAPQNKEPAKPALVEAKSFAAQIADARQDPIRLVEAPAADMPKTLDQDDEYSEIELIMLCLLA